MKNLRSLTMAAVAIVLSTAATIDDGLALSSLTQSHRIKQTSIVQVEYRPPVKPLTPKFNQAVKPKLTPKFNRAAGGGKKSGGGSIPPKLSGPKGPKFKPPRM